MASHNDHAEAASLDPHGFHDGEHHGHTIVSLRILGLVLGLLLVFTVLTVGLSRGEVWIAESLNVHIPQWVNVAIAMSIAVVKGTLVALFFMQLKYDNPLNAIIFLFCLCALGTFLGFTAIDMSNRGHINEWESGEITLGGTGNVPRTTLVKDATTDDGVMMGQDTVVGPIVMHVKGRIDVLEAADRLPEHHAKPLPESTANQSRVRTGLTPGLFAFSPKDDHAHHGHAEEHEEDVTLEPTEKNTEGPH